MAGFSIPAPQMDWQMETVLPQVLLYIDNSNIFECAKKFSALKKGYRSNIPDVACRLDVEKLISKAVGRRGLIRPPRLYGSEPTPNIAVWDAIRRKQVHVEVSERSTWTQKEKETDTLLTADAVEDIILCKEVAGNDSWVVLFSGDRDLCPVVKKALDHGYGVEIWGFENYTTTRIKQLEKEYPERVFFKDVAEIFNEVAFTNYDWSERKFPPDTTLVATVQIPTYQTPDEVFKNFVAKACEIFQLPMMGKYADNYKYILLAPCIKQFYKGKCDCHCHGKPIKKLSYDFYKDIQPYISTLKEVSPICNDIKTWVEFKGSLQLTDDSLLFETDTRFTALLAEMESTDDDDESTESSDDINHNHNSVSKNDGGAVVDRPDPFIPVVRGVYKKMRKFSKRCKHQNACIHGLKCSYQHTKDEMDFFRRQPDTKQRSKDTRYKTVPCKPDLCPGRGRAEMCPYAHGIEEARCTKCGAVGQHWVFECPGGPENYIA